MDKNKMINDNKANKETIGSMPEKSSLKIKLVYEVENRKVISLFSYIFFKLNKKRLKIIIDNKLCNLISNLYKVPNHNMELLKVKLLILNSHDINFIEMFYNCNSLKIFSIISKDESSLKNKLKEEQNENKIDSLSINNTEEINKESTNDIYLFNRAKVST